MIKAIKDLWKDLKDLWREMVATPRIMVNEFIDFGLTLKYRRLLAKKADPRVSRTTIDELINQMIRTGISLDELHLKDGFTMAHLYQQVARLYCVPTLRKTEYKP